MGSLFRSEDMTLCQLFLQVESAYQSISELGELGLAQFRDLNPELNSFQRKFIGEVKRCDEIERRLRFLEKEIIKCNIPIFDKNTVENVPIPSAKELIPLELTFEKHENELLEVIKSQGELHKTLDELTELKFLLEKAQAFFDLAELTSNPWSVDGEQLPGTSGQGGGGSGRGSGSGAVGDLNRRQTLGGSVGDISVSTSNAPVGKRKKSIFGGSRGIDFSRRFTQTGSLQLCFVSGVIENTRLHTFERILWRVCRGNVFFRGCPIDVPLKSLDHNDEPVQKTVFFIFFQGEELRSRILKICEGCRATMYPCPETGKGRQDALMNIIGRLSDLETVIERTQDHRQRLLGSFARNITTWLIKIQKIKAVYMTLNQFQYDPQVRCLIGEAWIPDFAIVQTREALTRASRESGSSVSSILNTVKDTNELPPTFHVTNKFTAGFQAIVDAYGVANYKEVNPAPFTIITFPFLFAVMFGDLGHGLVMALAAVWLIAREVQIIALAPKNEIFLTFFNGRYIIVLMGLFSMYTGIIYNDLFGKSMNLFQSSWTALSRNATLRIDYVDTNDTFQLDPKWNTWDEPYPFGIDPVWSLAANKILFLNSFKMKLSVILGVTHMLFGTCLSYFNAVQFVKPVDILCEVVPQILFMACTFGYMNVLIVYKWLVFTEADSGDAPSILLIIIDMFMAKEIKKEMFSGQAAIQSLLLGIALICIPWMLFIKPVTMWMQAKSAAKRKDISLETVVCNDSVSSGDAFSSGSNSAVGSNGKGDPRMNQVSYSAAGSSGDGEINLSVPEPKYRPSVSSAASTSHSTNAPGGHGHDGGEFDFAEVMIHQSIHTIEYCLGSVSNTASYLRLWALSLAHAQLSEVLWNMVMRKALSSSLGGFGTYLIFSFWVIATVGVLITMEGLSAFLHALRLHWVEFQSKFYTGAGEAFAPFSFKTSVATASIDAE